MASKNPMAIMYSNAGDQHSVILNRMRERGLAAAAGSDDPIGWFEWSAEPGCAQSMILRAGNKPIHR
jgi:hypothetical protein